MVEKDLLRNYLRLLNVVKDDEFDLQTFVLSFAPKNKAFNVTDNAHSPLFTSSMRAKNDFN